MSRVGLWLLLKSLESLSSGFGDFQLPKLTLSLPGEGRERGAEGSQADTLQQAYTLPLTLSPYTDPYLAVGHTTDTSWDHLVAPPRTWTHLVAHRLLRAEWGAV